MTLTPMEQLARKAMADAGVDPALARKAIQDICLEKRLYEGTNSVASGGVLQGATREGLRARTGGGGSTPGGVRGAVEDHGPRRPALWGADAE